MAGQVSHKLSNSFEGALAGGGDPATSPLYVFGPFLTLIIVAGVAQVTFGATIWLVVFTIALVSAMYRLVMLWITDGSGGSGLSEDEFGGWAVKVNAAITFIEYTLTFLVSMAAMVTFIADRFPVLNEEFMGIQLRTIVAIILSLITGWLVNHGPKTAARAFGPATAGVLLLSWAMIVSAIWQYGFHLPTIDWQAFSPQYLKFTFGGFTRMLAVMTGIEVFANLVAAYGGSERERSNKAFGSLLIIMGTTAVTMLVVGPAIFRLSNPLGEHVSVFTQTMDILLPAPLPYLGTLVGVAVLLSASAASAQGLQNLALGLKDRNYIPNFLGARNIYDVADKPVWIQVGLVSLIFLVAGTNEETYLAIYAAGVFILLSMTGWAASKRLMRQLQKVFSVSYLLVSIGTIIASTLTTGATVIIFQERFIEGAWIYFVLIPLLFVFFTYFRYILGDPTSAMERLGELEETMLGGFGYGQAFEPVPVSSPRYILNPWRRNNQINFRESAPVNSLNQTSWQNEEVEIQHILVPLDGSQFAEEAIDSAVVLCETYNSRLTLLSVIPRPDLLRVLPLSISSRTHQDSSRIYFEDYLSNVADRMVALGIETEVMICKGNVPEAINEVARTNDIDIIIMSSHGRSGLRRLLIGSVADKVIQTISKPILIIKPEAAIKPSISRFSKILVPLDGSEFAERVLPFAMASASFESMILLLSIPEIPEAHTFGAAVDEIQELRQKAEKDSRKYLENIAKSFRDKGFETKVIITGSRPKQEVVSVIAKEQVDVVMMATHGRGGLDRLFIGSVAEQVLLKAESPVFLVPIQERRNKRDK